MAIYIHETTEVTYGRIDEYCNAIGTVGVPCFEPWGLKLVGFYGTVYPAGAWPDVVALWRIESWAAYTRMILSAGAVPGMADWMKRAAVWRIRGFNRMLVPLRWSPTPPTAPARKTSGGVFLQQSFRTNPDVGAEFLQFIERDVRPQAEASGLTLELAARNSYNQFEFLFFWSLPGWDAYAEFLERRDADDGTQLPGLRGAKSLFSSVEERALAATQFSPLGGGDSNAADVLSSTGG